MSAGDKAIIGTTAIVVMAMCLCVSGAAMEYISMPPIAIIAIGVIGGVMLGISIAAIVRS
jgi:hypothetical protein